MRCPNGTNRSTDVPAALPSVHGTATTLTFEFFIQGGVLREELFVPTPRTRLAIRCDRDGAITVRILNGRTSG